MIFFIQSKKNIFNFGFGMIVILFFKLKLLFGYYSYDIPGKSHEEISLRLLTTFPEKSILYILIILPILLFFGREKQDRQDSKD